MIEYALQQGESSEGNSEMVPSELKKLEMAAEDVFKMTNVDVPDDVDEE
jgi:hypothetical protein